MTSCVVKEMDKDVEHGSSKVRTLYMHKNSTKIINPTK